MMPTAVRECLILHEGIESHCRKVTGKDDSTMCDISQEMLDDLYRAIKEKACEVQPFDRNNLLLCKSRVGETCLVYMVRLRQVWSQAEGLSETSEATLVELFCAGLSKADSEHAHDYTKRLPRHAWFMTDCGKYVATAVAARLAHRKAPAVKVAQPVSGEDSDSNCTDSGKETHWQRRYTKQVLAALEATKTSAADTAKAVAEVTAAELRFRQRRAQWGTWWSWTRSQRQPYRQWTRHTHTRRF